MQKTEASCDILIFGGTGDLALKKLLPALYLLHCNELLAQGTKIVGCSRKGMSNEAYKDVVKTYCQDYLDKNAVTDKNWNKFSKKLHYLSINAEQLADYGCLQAELQNKTRLFYLATSPSLFGIICKNLQLTNLITAESRVILEKPLGNDLKSARAINQQIATAFKEHQTFRIDHYLGKETVQNLLALRFANAMFEPLWCAEHIEHIQISVLETTGVEERGGYYEKSGALRDMVQNHLLQLLCMIAIEQPLEFSAHKIHDEKVKVLRSLSAIKGLDVQDLTVRGQYGADSGSTMPPYYCEKGISPESNVETFVAVKAEINNERWRGVPFYLRTGKRMSHKNSEIIIQFKDTMSLFQSPYGFKGNRLRIQLQPEEKIDLEVLAKRPGQGMALTPVELNLNLGTAFNTRQWPAYERLLLDAIQGDTTLFMRRDEVEAAWEWIDPIIESWERHLMSPKIYESGSFGPDKSNLLIQKDGFNWQNES